MILTTLLLRGSHDFSAGSADHRGLSFSFMSMLRKRDETLVTQPTRQRPVRDLVWSRSHPEGTRE